MTCTDFKAHCLSVFDRVATTGSSVRIFRRGRPLALVSPIGGSSTKRELGAFAGETIENGDILDFDGSADWESLGRAFRRDSADRILVASAISNGLTLLTADEKILDYAHVVTIDARKME